MTEYDILPAEQRALLSSLASLQDAGWILYGGTAVALQLGHRQSIDFDFFSDRPLNEEEIRSRAPILANARTIERAPRSWTLLTSSQSKLAGVKLSFFGGLRFGRVGEPIRTTGGELTLASLEDLLGHKLKVLLQRIEAKDYLDIAAMLRSGMSLATGLGCATALFDTFAPSEALRTLVWFGEGDLARLPMADRRLLEEASRSVGDVPIVPLRSRSLA